MKWYSLQKSVSKCFQKYSFTELSLGVVFRILYFLSNLSISLSVCPWQTFLVVYNVTLQLIGPILKLEGNEVRSILELKTRPKTTLRFSTIKYLAHRSDTGLL
jgi:hypothetical protein